MQIHWPLVVTAFVAFGSAACDHNNSNNGNNSNQNNSLSTGGTNEDASSGAPSGPCEATACGPQAETARVCPDGTAIASQCTRSATGACEWQFDCAGHETPPPAADAGTTAEQPSTAVDAGAATTTSVPPDAGARRRRH